MKLEGVLGACDLPDIFHLLSSTGRRGVLVVSRGGTERKLYFGPEGITLLFDTSRASRLLGQILLARGIIDEKVLNLALERQRAFPLPLGEILCDLGAARPEQVEDALAYQLREELFHILTWQDARFKFHEGGERPIEAGRSYSRTPSFNPEAIIMEAARRADEWQRIRQVITSEHAVPLKTSPDVALTGELSESEVASALLDLADGTLSVEQMVEVLGRSKFDVYECIHALLGAGVVKLADARELVDLAAAALEASATERARKLLLRAAACCGDHLGLRYEIGTMFLRAPDEDQARKNLDVVLRHLVGEKLTSQVERMLDQVRDDFPDVPYSYERRLELLDPHKDFQQALPLALLLLELYERRHDTRTAGRMLRYLGTFTVTRTEDLLQLGRMLESHGSPVSAARMYCLAANQFRYGGRSREALRFYRKALSLDRKLTEAQKELDYLLRHRLHPLGTWVLRAAAVLAVLAVPAVAGFVVYREHVARQALERTTVLADKLLLEKDFDKAVEAYRGILSAYPHTGASAGARRQIALIGRQQQNQAGMMQQAEQRLVEEAERAERELDLEGAIRAYQKLTEVALTEDVAEQAGEHIRRLRAEKDDYGKLLAEARALEAAQRYPPALRSYLAARERSPRLFDHDDVKLPVVLESEPPGAGVLRGGEFVGTTPLLLHRRVGEVGTLVLRCPGFADTPVKLSPETDGAVLRAELIHTRRPLWTFRGEGAIDQPVRVWGTTCYVSTRQGRLYALSLQTGQPLWERRLDIMPGEYLSAPLVVQERLFVAVMDGSLLAFSSATGEPLWRLPGQGLLVAPPAWLASEGLVVLLHPDGTAEHVDPDQGVVVRRLKLPRPIRGSTLIVGDVLYYGTDDHALQAFDLRTASAGWKWRPGRPVTGGMGCLGNILYVPLQDMGIAAVPLDQGKPVWRFSDSHDYVATPAANGDYVFLAGREGPLTAVSARGGKLVWCVSVDRRVSAGLTADSKQVYVGTTDGLLSAYRPSDGRLLWQCSLAGPLASPPLAAGNRVLVTTTNGAVHAFEP